MPSARVAASVPAAAIVELRCARKPHGHAGLQICVGGAVEESPSLAPTEMASPLHYADKQDDGWIPLKIRVDLRLCVVFPSNHVGVGGFL